MVTAVSLSDVRHSDCIKTIKPINYEVFEYFCMRLLRNRSSYNVAVVAI